VLCLCFDLAEGGAAAFRESPCATKTLSMVSVSRRRDSITSVR
jgi:hypothetical protein